MSDNDALNPGPKTGAHLTSDDEHVGGPQGGAGYSFDVKRLRWRQPARQSTTEVCDRQQLDVVAIKGGGNRPPGAENQR